MTNFAWIGNMAAVMYGCIPDNGERPNFMPQKPWYESPSFIQDPPNYPTIYPTFSYPIDFPTQKTADEKIKDLESRCSELESRILSLENKISRPHQPASLRCTCDELPEDALHWKGCPAGRDSRSHNDGLEFLRAWIDGHFGKLELDSPTLFKIKQMIDSIGPKVRRHNQ